MGDFGVGSRVGQLDQNWDKNINVKSDQGSFKTVQEAQKKAEEVAASDSEDAVIVKDKDGKFHVFGIDEIGKINPEGNTNGEYQIHDMEVTALNFVISKRDDKGVKTGGEINVAPRGMDMDDSELREKVKILDTNGDGRITKAEVESLKMRVLTNQVSLQDAKEALMAARILFSTKEIGGKIKEVAGYKDLSSASKELDKTITSKTSFDDNCTSASSALSYTLGLGLAAANKYRGISEGARSLLALPGQAISRGVASGMNGKMSIDSAEDVENVASVTKTTGYGNCQEQACVAAMYLKEHGVPNVEVMGIPNHAFVVIGRDPNSDPGDPTTWGPKAVVCDPWYGETFPASELKDHQHNKGTIPDTRIVAQVN